MILAVANQKGGVGKTTAAISLAAVWASQGRRVLLVDMDPQGNASAGLGVEEASLDVTVSEVLRGDHSIREATCSVPGGIDLLPADIGLAALEAEDISIDSVIEVLKQTQYDRIVIDCPPSLGRLTLCSLAAADRVLVPIRAGRFSLHGLRQLLMTVDNVRVRGINPRLRPVGIFINEAQPRTHLHQLTESTVRRMYGEMVFDNFIPSNVTLGEAVTVGEPITLYDPDAAGARAFVALAEEVEAKWDRVVRSA